MRYCVTERLNIGQTQPASDLAANDSSSIPTLLILGAGPKAIAIAAKQAVLQKLGYVVPQLVIVDNKGIVSNWSGRAGFTDGRQLLGTRPEKDIGFPYTSLCWGNKLMNKAIANQMLLLSWPSYLIHEGKYADWIDRGRSRPTHKEWAGYLQWVALKVDIDVVHAEVYRIGCSEDNTQWQLACRAIADGTELTLQGDGLVITGPGTPITISGQPTHHPRVMDGSSFWLRVDEFARMRGTTQPPLHIGVIGTGETAAATVIALVNALDDTASIEVISRYGVLYSRDEGFGENRLFSDPDGRLTRGEGGHEHLLKWTDLTEGDRREFVRRTDRGVFSVHAMDEVNRAENVLSIVGTARNIDATDDCVFVDMEYDGRMERDQYDYVIVAIGFNSLWFTDLLDEQARARLDAVTNNLERRAIEFAIEEDLSVRDLRPRLHLPMLAGVSQGPGFPNLSCLGLLADRVLGPYGVAMPLNK
jgi:mycobactin lysine-N-oxygenase